MDRDRFADIEESVESLYVSESHLIIPIKVESDIQLFDAHDYLGIRLAPGIAQYIDSCAAKVRGKLQVRLVFYCPHMPLQKQDAVRNLIRIHYGTRVQQSNRRCFFLAVQSVLLAVCAAVFAVCCVLAAHTALAGLATGIFAVSLGAAVACSTKTLQARVRREADTRVYNSRIEFK